jgi:hypothetical protein
MEDLLSLYGLTTFFLALVWSYCYVMREDLRRELLILGGFSLLLMPLAFALESHTQFSLRINFARLSAVDLGFSFFLSGIAGTIFHTAFGTHYHHLPLLRRQTAAKQVVHAQALIAKLFLGFLFLIWGIALFTLGFHLSIPMALFLSSLLLTLFVISHRHDLLQDALWSAFLTTAVVFIATTVSSWIVGQPFSLGPVHNPILVLGVPQDLLLWSLTCGVALGPVYEFARSLK